MYKQMTTVQLQRDSLSTQTTIPQQYSLHLTTLKALVNIFLAQQSSPKKLNTLT